MGIDVGELAAGAVIGAVASDLYEKGKHVANPNDHGILHGSAEDSAALETLGNIETLLREGRQTVLAPKFEEFYVQGSEPLANRLTREGYKHVSLWTATAFTIDCRMPIVDQIGKFALTVGWNPLDLPNATALWTDNGTPQTVVLYKGDDSLDIEGV